MGGYVTTAVLVEAGLAVILSRNLPAIWDAANGHDAPLRQLDIEAPEPFCRTHADRFETDELPG